MEARYPSGSQVQAEARCPSEAKPSGSQAKWKPGVKGCKGIEFVKVQECKEGIEARYPSRSQVQAEVRCRSGRQMLVRKPVQVEAVDHADIEVSKSVKATCGSQSKWKLVQVEAGYGSVLVSLDHPGVLLIMFVCCWPCWHVADYAAV